MKQTAAHRAIPAKEEPSGPCQGWWRMRSVVPKIALVAASMASSIAVGGAQTGVITPDREAPEVSGARHPALPGFTMQQRAAIYSAVMQANRPPALPLDMQIEIGTKLADSAEVQPLPEAARAQVPAASNYKYALWRDQVLLVDASNNTVADILHGDVLQEYLPRR